VRRQFRNGQIERFRGIQIEQGRQFPFLLAEIGIGRMPGQLGVETSRR
jgi:hypothetical protein